MNQKKEKSVKPVDKKSQKLRVAITYEWEVTPRQWESNKKFHDSLEENIRWKANDDPKSMFYFMNEIDHQPNVKVEVDRIS